MKTRLSLILSLFFLLFTMVQCSKVDSTGANLYDEHCMVCHMDDGLGLDEFIPPIAKADYVLENRGELACIIKHGLKGEITVNDQDYDVEMQGVELSEVEITNLLNYMLSTWYAKQPDFTLTEVKDQLSGCDLNTN